MCLTTKRLLSAHVLPLPPGSWVLSPVPVPALVLSLFRQNAQNSTPFVNLFSFNRVQIQSTATLPYQVLLAQSTHWHIQSLIPADSDSSCHNLWSVQSVAFLIFIQGSSGLITLSTFTLMIQRPCFKINMEVYSCDRILLQENHNVASIYVHHGARSVSCDFSS